MSVVTFWMIHCCVICYGRLKAPYVFSFVKGDVFICLIWNQDVDRCFPFDLVNSVNDIDVGVPTLYWIVICDE